MEYNLKDKIEITEGFLDELISKNWQEVEAVQQQIANIDKSTRLGAEVAKLLSDACTNYYILIGCLENLAEKQNTEYLDVYEQAEIELEQKLSNSEISEIPTPIEPPSKKPTANYTDDSVGNYFEPFEYFVDFEDPIGEPISDEELYGK